MKLNAPKKITWWVSVVLIVVGVLAKFVDIPVLEDIQDIHFWIVTAGAVLLALATYLKGL